MKPTAPANSDGDAVTYQLDPTWKAQYDLHDPTRGSTYTECWRITCVQCVQTVHPLRWMPP